MNGGGKVVCVTGASGYIASWIVKLLLLRGYTVKATVRDPRDAKKTKHLLTLEGADERLKLFKADLLEDGSFEQAIEGCDGVFHIASPVSLTATNPQARYYDSNIFWSTTYNAAKLIDPAVNGTLNVLKTCARASSVKRVIVTSSTATILGCNPPFKPNDVVDVTFFTDPSFCSEMKVFESCCDVVQWYALSKTLAEDAAVQFSKENGIDLIVMNPGNVIGPLLQPTLNYSVGVIVDLINGKIPSNSFYYRFMDVRDVSLAHIKAFEIPSANGRYITVDPNITMKDIKKLLNELFPDKNEESELNGMAYKVCVDKMKSELGIEFTPIEATLRDTIASLKEKCLLT
ncbi:hypothetical protein AALP_AA1G099200 [Arabis alpina]|uniref:NAD-dependent epimerase/dehydratase domain-containing protein n=1 Tax=Arabis alpina TaxID=50452 RepID=A0A087HM97_ARAAL|nr:hypothetical protein AALP_AA1G099200 [Arabis alpina]